MYQIVFLADDLVSAARRAGATTDEAIAKKIESWVRLGQKIEAIFTPDTLMEVEPPPISELVAIVGTPAGDRKVAEYLKSQPYPHYEAGGGRDILVRIDADGTRTRGRIVDREF